VLITEVIAAKFAIGSFVIGAEGLVLAFAPNTF
jgi:hypothetical protein